jgi:hypothetical protein
MIQKTEEMEHRDEKKDEPRENQVQFVAHPATPALSA